MFLAETSHMATLQPSEISWRASSRPMPVPPPVTMAIFPAKSCMACFPGWPPCLCREVSSSLARRPAGVHRDAAERRWPAAGSSGEPPRTGRPAMKLYLSPGACSLADHIALHEAGLDFDRIKVDLKAKRTEDGRDYSQINPKGYVPALEFDDGEVLTENIAILSVAADKAPALTPAGQFGRFRLLEMLAFISTEIHKAFKP